MFESPASMYRWSIHVQANCTAGVLNTFLKLSYIKFHHFSHENTMTEVNIKWRIPQTHHQGSDNFLSVSSNTQSQIIHIPANCTAGVLIGIPGRASQSSPTGSEANLCGAILMEFFVISSFPENIRISEFFLICVRSALSVVEIWYYFLGYFLRWFFFGIAIFLLPVQWSCSSDGLDFFQMVPIRLLYCAICFLIFPLCIAIIVVIRRILFGTIFSNQSVGLRQCVS